MKLSVKNKELLRTFFALTLLMLTASIALAYDFKAKFASLESPVIYDRHGEIIATRANARGYFSRPIVALPSSFEKMLLEKEDKHFYLHPGINPVSILRRPTRGSSTITQQLAKITLGNELKRSVANKIAETLYSLSLEFWTSKREILSMYSQSVYLGRLAQGFAEASYVYFNKPLADLSEQESQALIGTLTNPGKLAPKVATDYRHNSPTLFELETAGINCSKNCITTIDGDLTERLRALLARQVENESYRGVTNGVIIVLKEPENEVLAMIGSPDPSKSAHGSQINMALEPRPIGSTIKPFIYARAFEKGLRPYSKIEDREYRYSIGTGFALYPKNYDGKYRGTVSAAEALSNSLNVPAVKTLEYVGLDDFYNILQNKLSFTALNDLSSYQLGIALGGLEMDPLTLAEYFSVFPNKGKLKPLKLTNAQIPISFTKSRILDSINRIETPMSRVTSEKQIFDQGATELVNRILSDRTLAVDQFGAKSSLNLPQNNYAVKTGTSRDYHDSWTIGWTPDYLVLAWVGNAQNTGLAQVSGQSGAGMLWYQTMSILAGAEYNHGTPFDFSHINSVQLSDNISWGLPGDVVAEHEHVLSDSALIISPHEGDIFSVPGGQNNISIPLEATSDVDWYDSGTYIGHGKRLIFSPTLPGRYKIRAVNESGQDETVSFIVELSD